MRRPTGLGFSRVALSVRRAASAWITVLTYHRVARKDDPTVLDEDVVDVCPEQLARHLRFIKRWFDPIGVDQLCAFARGRGRLPRNPLMVTFDDGYRDNHDVALPILVKHGVRAVFFLATDYVQRRKLYWWDRVSLLVARSRRPRLVMAYPEPTSISLEGPDARRKAARRIQRIVKDRSGLDLGRFLDELERAADVTIGTEEERRLVDKTVMTWEHANALRRAGMDVQSHTQTHRVLQTLDGRDLERELRGSRETLEDALGAPVLGISYPVGRPVGDAPQIPPGCSGRWLSARLLQCHRGEPDALSRSARCKAGIARFCPSGIRSFARCSPFPGLLIELREACLVSES